MKRNLLILGLTLMIVFMAGQAMSFTFRLEITRDDSTLTEITKGLDFNIDIYMNNDDSAHTDDGTRMAWSTPFTFFSDDQTITTVTYIDSGGGSPPNGLPNLITLNGFDGSDIWGWFWSANGVGHTWNYDGILPDTFNLSGIGNGWAWGLGEQHYLRFAFNIDQVGSFCIDSISIHPDYPDSTNTYDWLLDPPSPAFGGPYCWNVVEGSAVADNDKRDLLPQNFELSQNYPNPFNPSTVIDFALPTKADVTLTVFNILGQRIKTLANGEYAAGFHTAVWDGTNDNGNPAASGIYFYKITADKYTNTKKLMLLK